MAQKDKKAAPAARNKPASASQDAAKVPPMVGIGASAGGIGAYQSFFEHVPADSGIAWVVIQHMAPDRESSLSEIIGRKTVLPVTEVTEIAVIQPDHVYVIAPGRIMTMRDGSLRPVTDSDPLARRSSIDAFFLSLAAHQGERCGCALLSGAGTDGTIGLKAVKEAGGLTVTQTLDDAEYDSMLLSAVRTGLVDLELPLSEMPEAFVDYLIRCGPPVVEEAVGDGERLQVCHLLRKSTGHDFSGYKISTVDRRIRRRMQMRGIGDLGDYLKRLQADRDELGQLYHDLLIGVTQFFRDPEAFIAVAQHALPKIFERKTADDEVRIWAAGCATGEEAYSLAMLLQETADRLPSAPMLRVFGSDIDENALHVARHGRYPRGIAADVTAERLERFFEREDGTYRVGSELREMCLFAQHNMLRDPPFSRIDLISCRNVLIYMNGDLQKRLLPVFHYALRPEGFLFLGPAENASQRPGLFADDNRAHRIYRRVGEATRLPEFPIAAGDGHHRAMTDVRRVREQPEGLAVRAARQVLERTASAYVIIDAEYDIIEASAGTGAYLELPSGRPRTNLSAMMRSGLAVEVRAAVGKAISSSKPDTRTAVAGSGANRKELSIAVEPLQGDPRDGHLYLVIFQELPMGERGTAPATGGSDDEVTRALETELQTTRERLQSTLEELETSNEELRVSNEEISSVNEELQSANEELETSKEELQSINEELRTVNNELNSRVDDLGRANNDLRNLLDNTQIAMVFLDRKFRIRNFTPPAKPLFRLRDHDVGRPLDELAGPLNYADLKKSVEKVIKHGKAKEREVEVSGGDKRTYIMRVLPYRDEREKIQGAVLAFIDITERKRSETRLASMVSELNHRVKNALASVQAMVRQTGATAKSVPECVETIDGRLQAMASAHNLLSAAQWEHVDLGELVDRTLAPFAEPGSKRLRAAGLRMELHAGCAVSMAMILHELATNAAKYGAWSTPAGRVAVHWELLSEDAENLALTWTEKDGPAAVEPEKAGFGLRFVQRCVAHELRGDCRPAFGPEGFSCRFNLPVERIRWLPSESAAADG